MVLILAFLAIQVQLAVERESSWLSLSSISTLKSSSKNRQTWEALVVCCFKDTPWLLIVKKRHVVRTYGRSTISELSWPGASVCSSVALCPCVEV